METLGLPPGDEKLVTPSNYWNTKDFKPINRMRVVSQVRGGWRDWDETKNKPVRSRPEDKPSKPLNTEKPQLKFFWALYVWDYERQDLFILELVQSTVIEKLRGLINDKDWGVLSNYDIKITKNTGAKTTYDVIPCKPSPMAAEIKKKLLERPVNLEALYQGGNPWTDLDVDTGMGEYDREALIEIQFSRVEELVEQDPDSLEKIKVRFSVEHLHDIDPSYYQPMIDWLLQRKEARHANVA